MCTVFRDIRGIVLVDILTSSETVNVEHYCETLQKLRRAIQNKRCETVGSSIILLYDKARPLTAPAGTQLGGI